MIDNSTLPHEEALHSYWRDGYAKIGRSCWASCVIASLSTLSQIAILTMLFFNYPLPSSLKLEMLLGHFRDRFSQMHPPFSYFRFLLCQFWGYFWVLVWLIFVSILTDF